MDNNILKHFHVNYKQIIIDEIALDGLEGIGLDLLWRRVGKRISSDLTEKMKARFWKYIVTCNKISFYQLPEPLPYVEVLDRFEIVDPTTGHLQEPDYLDGYYEYKPIEGEHGSSMHYYTRKLITSASLQDKTYEQVVTEYGDKFVIVANEEERIHALAQHMPATYLTNMSQLHYCLLELIGKSRGNGQMTIGKTNLLKIMKEPKTLFYIRKHLRALDLIKICNITQMIGGKGVKSLLVRLKRFHQPSVLSMPKTGVLHNVIDYLMQKPNFCEKTEVIVKTGFISQKQNRRLQKTVNIFNFEERALVNEDKSKKSKGTMKRKFMFLSSKSDESSESDEENNDPPLKCQYKVGVALLRQAYERFLDAGLDGLTQVQLAQLLGVEFYTSRGICRIFKLRNIVREYLEDRGKQRTARFIAVAATGEMDVKYADEKKKFLEYLEQQKYSEETEPEPSTSFKKSDTASDEDEIPLKKIKLEKESDKLTGINFDFDMSTEHDITELKILDGVESVKPLGTFKKNPTLRQLTFANGIFKVLQEKKCICGYQTLSNLVSKEINEPPLDTKALKSFIQRLVTDGHIKVFKLKWPGIQKCSILICAPNIKKTDPLIKAKYKEICIRAVTNKRLSLKKDIKESSTKPITQFSYPRYMKIQALHEFLMKYAYFEVVKPESHSLPQGYVSIVDFIQEVTVEFVVNNMGSMGMLEVSELLSENHLKLKLKDAPRHIYKALMRSNTLQNTIRINLKVLGMLGLIQLVRTPSQTPSTTGMVTYSSFLFYVNRRAKILDTAGVWPRRTAEKAKERSYYFETFEDVTKYWNDVYQISTNTVIELPIRDRKKLNPPLRDESEVRKYDNGARYGDGNGPCGFDSCFYMEIPRLWRTFYMRPNKSHVSKKKISVKIPKTKAGKKHKESKVKPPKAIVEKTNEKLTRKRNDTTVRWSKQEDLILTMCKAAITILSPSSQPGSLIVRNIVAKDILSILDPKKTKGVCHTRASTIESNVTLNHEKQCIINELRRRRNLIQKYEGLLKNLRIRFSTNMSKYINKARVPMMELVWIISQVMHSQAYNERVPCVAASLEDFHKHFTITTSTANKLCNMYKTPPEYATLKEAIMLTIIQTLDSEISTEMGKKIYKTYKEFPEASLRTVVEQLRKCGAIAAKEKIFNNQMRKLDLEDIVQSSYKMSAFYQRKWVNRLNSEFLENMAAILDSEQIEKDVKGSAEINCVYCEMHSCDVIDTVSSTIPVITDSSGSPIFPEEINVLVIDTKYKLKTGALRWTNKSNVKILSELYGHLDISNGLQYLSRYTTIGANELNQKLNLENKIISHLDSKAEKGSLFRELQEVTGYERKDLIQKLELLETKKIVRRVGFYENVLILTKYVEPWSVKIGDKYVICTPWLNLSGDVKLDIFFKWTGALMNLIFEKPGSSVSYLADKSEYLTCKAVQDICMFLEKYECTRLSCVNNQQIDIFSDEDAEPIFDDFNPYDNPENILVFPVQNSLTKFAYVKKGLTNMHSNSIMLIDC